jgi:hypothetical protein
VLGNTRAVWRLFGVTVQAVLRNVDLTPSPTEIRAGNMTYPQRNIPRGRHTNLLSDVGLLESTRHGFRTREGSTSAVDWRRAMTTVPLR